MSCTNTDQGPSENPGVFTTALKALRRLRAAGGRHENAAFHSLLLTRSEHDEYHPTQHLLRFQMSANLAGLVPRLLARKAPLLHSGQYLPTLVRWRTDGAASHLHTSSPVS